MEETGIRVLIVEDNFISRRILKDILSPYGICDVAINGEEAVEAFNLGWVEKCPYDLICMDIMMPEVDGHEAMKRIRDMEKAMGVDGPEEVKIIMVSALDDVKSVFKAYSKGGAMSYLVKPIKKEKVLDEVRKLGLID